MPSLTELNATLMPHSIIHGDACFAYFNNIWDIPLPGSGFTLSGATPTADAALVSASGELKLKNRISLTARLDGEIKSNSRSYAATGTVRYVW